MGFSRTNETEYFVGDHNSKMEDDVSAELAKVQERPASLADYVQASLGKSAYVNNKYSVADMVKDLINRTGLKEYVKSVEAETDSGTEKRAYQNTPATGTEINVNGPATESNSEDGLSLLDAPELAQNILNYIEAYKLDQAQPVLAYVRKEREKLPEKFADLDPNYDPKLITFIKKNLFDKATDSFKEPPTAESTNTLEESAVPAWAADKKGQE